VEGLQGRRHTAERHTQIQVRYALLSILTLRFALVHHGHPPNSMLTNLPIPISPGHAPHGCFPLNVSILPPFILIWIPCGFRHFAIRSLTDRIRQMVCGREHASVRFWKVFLMGLGFCAPQGLIPCRYVAVLLSPLSSLFIYAQWVPSVERLMEEAERG